MAKASERIDIREETAALLNKLGLEPRDVLYLRVMNLTPSKAFVEAEVLYRDPTGQPRLDWRRNIVTYFREFKVRT